MTSSCHPACLRREERIRSRCPFSFASASAKSRRIRARADAKVAFSLSGGLDSSSIVASAAQYLPENLTAYTVHFPGHPNDEEEYAKSVYLRYKEKIDWYILCIYQKFSDNFIIKYHELIKWETFGNKKVVNKNSQSVVRNVLKRRKTRN